MPEIINLKEKMFILAHSFGCFYLWLVGHVAFVPVMRKPIMAELLVKQNCSPYGQRPKERERGKFWGSIIPFKGTPPPHPHT